MTPVEKTSAILELKAQCLSTNNIIIPLLNGCGWKQWPEVAICLSVANVKLPNDFYLKIMASILVEQLEEYNPLVKLSMKSGDTENVPCCKRYTMESYWPKATIPL